ncbi:class I SAM-dependent methyltransferase [Gryllotalpicola koreensis]|uniref:Class I SAM-dependent methyltransferase n=1 Tax=Gryllotalpicola koreensis TaxID=993086 RepID=A0ABP7ZUS3_9MICO
MHAHDGDRSGQTPADFWEHRYSSSERIWSGKVNQVLADVAASLLPGRALDLGCGEGADVIWLAQHGWTATGMDISRTAIDRAAATAQAEGLEPERARFIAGDLTEVPEGAYDLVTASFFHSPVELARADILRQAAERVAHGGHLLITAHADPPPASDISDGHDQRFLSPDEQVAQLDLDPELWSVLIAEKRARQATMPDGRQVVLEDVVVLARRA